LAYAERLEGPWQLYQPKKGVLALAANGRIDLGDGIVVHGHVASPDAHVDEEHQRIILYFHGPAKAQSRSGQLTFVTTSGDGLDFNGHIKPAVISTSYLRVSRWRGGLCGLCMEGDVLRPRDPADPWRQPDNVPIGANAWEAMEGRPLLTALCPSEAVPLRHLAVKLNGDTLTVFFTRKNETPERIYYSKATLTADWKPWRFSPPIELLRPERDYEGALMPLVPSKSGRVLGMVNQLRDPCYFRDADGKEYLLYSVAGEHGIAIVRLRDESP
jgi:hypothetical protein